MKDKNPRLARHKILMEKNERAQGFIQTTGIYPQYGYHAGGEDNLSTNFMDVQLRC